MRIFLKKRTPGQIEFGIVYGGIALLALMVARFLPVLSFAPSCVFKGLTGVPCPTCGSTRSIVRLSHGDLAASLLMNPLMSMTLIAALVVFAYSLITLITDVPRIGVSFSEQEKDMIRTLSVLLILANWLYVGLAL